MNAISSHFPTIIKICYEKHIFILHPTNYAFLEKTKSTVYSKRCVQISMCLLSKSAATTINYAFLYGSESNKIHVNKSIKLVGMAYTISVVFHFNNSMHSFQSTNVLAKSNDEGTSFILQTFISSDFCDQF